MANLIRRRREDREPTTGLAASALAPLESLRMMRDLLGWDPLGDLGMGPLAFVPSFDVKETNDAYIISADLPGVKEEDLEVSLTENRLTVSGRREEERREENDRYYAAERSYGAFSRSFTLPPGADPDNVRAEFKDGVLRVTIGKRPEVQPRRISLTGKEPEKAKA